MGWYAPLGTQLLLALGGSEIIRGWEIVNGRTSSGDLGWWT